MKLESIIATKAIRLFPISKAVGGKLRGAALARAFEDRYGFLQGPRTVEEFDSQKGIVFRQGQIANRPPVETLTIYSDGFVCDTKADSVEADFFIDDVIKWAQDENAFTFEGLDTARRLYISNIDVKMDADVHRALKGFDEFCQHITSKVRGYGHKIPEFTPFRIGFHGDATTQPESVAPPAFVVERRDNQPYSSKRYFSTAPLSTPDHLEALAELERIFLAMTSA